MLSFCRVGQPAQVCSDTVNERVERVHYYMRYPFDEPGFYAIQVAGEVDDNWSDRLGGMTLIKTETAEVDAKPVTVLIGSLADQAALVGVLDTLYENRYPLLYVKYLGSAKEEQRIR